MRLAFIADSRSSHTQNWLRYFVGIGDEVLLMSTFPGPEIPGVKSRFLPGLFRIRNTLINGTHVSSSKLKSGILRFVFLSDYSKVIFSVWQQARALDLLLQVRQAQKVLKEFHPDLVHALRIQNEGYVGGWAKYHPLIMSSWGSDFVYVAKKYPVHSILTRLVTRKPDAFIADCLRDVRLAHAYGLPTTVPTRCFPGNGGIDQALFHPVNMDLRARERIILYTRGYSPFARIDVLLEAFKIMLVRKPSHLTKLVLLVPREVMSMVDHMRQNLGLSKLCIQVRTSVSQAEMVHLLQTAAVSVSPMESDGTPISMLEAMACGAFPVMSDLESIREWIIHGHNGLLFNPDNPEELAACLEEAIDNVPMRQSAQEVNAQLINDRADYVKVMPQVREFYQMVARAGRQKLDRCISEEDAL